MCVGVPMLKHPGHIMVRCGPNPQPNVCAGTQCNPSVTGPLKVHVVGGTSADKRFELTQVASSNGAVDVMQTQCRPLLFFRRHAVPRFYPPTNTVL